MISTLPVLMILSWVPVVNDAAPAQAPAPPPTPQEAGRPAHAADTIRCPLTGQQIPSCCCPIRK